MLLEKLAYAQEAGKAAGPAGMFGALGSFLPLILIFVVFYFLLIRPQQKRQKQHVEMLNALKTGDEVLTNGGIYGNIVQVLDVNTFMIEIANGIKIKVAKGGIASKVDSMSATTATHTPAPEKPNPTGINSKKRNK